MLKGILTLVTLLGSVSFASSAAEKTYSIYLNPHATSYKGEKFNRHFLLKTTFKIADKITGKAKSYDNQNCDFDDNGMPLNCVDACVSTVVFNVGTLLTKAKDLDTGKIITTEEPVQMSARSESEVGACNGSVPQISRAAESDNAARTPEMYFAKKQQQLLQVMFSSYSADIKNLGNDNYEITKVNLPENLNGIVFYTHVIKDMLTWGVSARVVDGQIIKEPGLKDGFN